MSTQEKKRNKTLTKKMKEINWRSVGIYSTIVLGGAAVGSGISLGVVLPQALAAKDGLENFIPNGGGANSLAGKEKVNYVAIGDSATAGANGTLGQTYRSYSDFLAMSFKNANKLGNYSNFAYSGGRLADISKDLFEFPSAGRVLRESDLITITIGANDILAILNYLNITSFYNFPGIAAGVSSLPWALEVINNPGSHTAAEITQANTINDNWGRLNADISQITIDDLNDQDFKNWAQLLRAGAMVDKGELSDDREELFDQDIQYMTTKEDAKTRYTQSASEIIEILKGNPEPYLNLDRDWNAKIFDLVEREVATLVHDLHEAAPKAEIIFLGYAFPFEQFPDELREAPKPAIQQALETKEDMSLNQSYDYLLEKIENGVETTTGKENKYAKFIDINELEPVVEANAAGAKVNYDSLETFKSTYTNKVMPNITDIHPSVFGYDKIGEGLFEILGKEIGLSQSEIASNLQSSNPYDSEKEGGKWNRLDEDPVLLEKLYTQHLSFYAMLDAPTQLGTNLPGENSSISKIFDSVLNYLNNQIDGKNNDALTTEQIADLLPDKGLAFGGNDIMPVIKKYLKDETLNPLLNFLKPVLEKIKTATDTIAQMSLDIKNINDFFTTNGEAINTRQTLSFGIYGGIKMFADFSQILLNLQDVLKEMTSLIPH